MGAWGTGINSNDTAADVLETCKEIYPIVSPDEANQLVLEEYRELLTCEEDDDELADFWYALANWQWDHGVLPEKNKITVLNMLEKGCGMTRWFDEKNQTDIRKRTNALDKLQAKLISEQPSVKIPRANIKKPKHKPGDVIIFNTIEFAERDIEHLWTISRLSSPKYFVNSCDLPQKLSSPYVARGKYLALLCVETEQEPYSKHFPNLFHEHSVYSFYDYCEYTKPTINDLELCGFLPNIDISYSDFNRGIVDGLEWTYKFITIDPFRANYSFVVSFEKINSADEHARFHRLMSEKDYLGCSLGCFTLEGAFESFFEEKLRFSEVGVSIDNLLKPFVRNPQLLSPIKYNKQKNR